MDRKTVTSIFMVPTLKISRDNLFMNNCINGYSVDKHREVQYKNCIYLLFKPDDMDRFREFLDEEYVRTKELIDDYDYEDGFVVLVYKLPNKWKKDFALVREGLYSKTSEEFQSVFPKILKVIKNGLQRDEISLQYRIFNKSIQLREYWEELIGLDISENAEVWNTFEIDKETLDLEIIKEDLCVQ
jgi:hypothetical protein